MTNNAPSPLTLANGVIPPYLVSTSQLITVALASSAGVSLWNVTCIGVDDETNLAGLASINAQLNASINHASNTATFTVPGNDGYGAAVILQVTVNNGLDSQGKAQTSYTTTFKVGCLSASGVPVYALGETDEGGVFGWIPGINNAARSSSNAGSFPVGIAAGGDLSGTYPNPSVSALAGLPITGTPTPGHVLGTDGSHAVWVAQSGGGGGGGGSAATYQVLQLLNLPPSSASQTVFVDGYSASGDGYHSGYGSFVWNSKYIGPSSPMHVVPDGYAQGAWDRVVGPDHTIQATWFGAKGDVHYAPTEFVNYVGTDDTAAIQEMLDFNNIYTEPNVSNGLTFRSDEMQYICKLPASGIKMQSFLVAPRTCYRITSPLQINDVYINLTGNTTNWFVGEPGAWSGLYHEDFLGPALVCGNAGINTPTPTLDPSGSGEYLMAVGQLSGIEATLSSGSNGAVLPQSTLHVVSTAGFAPAGEFYLNSVSGAYLQQYVRYTGLTTNTFTGCTYTNLTAGTTLATGDTCLPYPTPSWNFSDYDIGDLQGWTSFTVEWFINPGNSTDYMNTVQPGAYIASLFGCGGTMPHQQHQTMLLLQDNISDVDHWSFDLTTANGTFRAQTSTAHQTTLTPNVLNHFAVSYDGSQLRMFINGAQPDDSMTIAATGALDQRWYEMIVLCAGGNPAYPFFGGTIEFQPSSPGNLLGKFRFSNIARYTAPFTAPLPSAVTCDVNTRVYLDFAPSSLPARANLNVFNIAQCGTGRFGKITNGIGFPVWLNNHTVGPAYTSGDRIKSMFFVGAGTAIHTFAATDSEFGEDCLFLGQEQGIMLDDFSYNSGIGPNCTFWQLGEGIASSNYLTCEILFGPGSQFAYVSDGWSSGFGACNWSMIGMFADVQVGNGFPNSYNQGTFAWLQDVSTIYMDGAVMLDDETAGFKTAGTLFAPGTTTARLTWNGGYIGMEDSSENPVPIILIAQAGCPVDVDTSIFSSSCPVFSFQGPGAATTVPAIMSTTNGYTPNLVDANNQGPVMVKQQEAMGKNTINFTADGYMTLGWSDFLWNTLEFNDPSSLLTQDGYQIYLPTVFNGYTRKIQNNTAHTLQFLGSPSVGGWGVTIGARKWATIQSNGSRWVRVTADTGQDAFTPTAISGCQTWLRADLGVSLSGSSVTAWADQSSNVWSVSQATGGNQPQFVASDPNLGGQPSISFTSATQWLQASAGSISQPDTVYVVCHLDTAADQQTFFDGTSNRQQSNYSGDGRWELDNIIATTFNKPAVTTGNWVTCNIFNSTTSQIYVNSSTSSLCTGDIGTAALSYLIVGSATNAPSGSTIAEIIVYSGAHTQAQRAQVFAYFSDRYGLNNVS